MGYSAKAVANYFLSKYRKAGISPLKMQKLVYIAHGWYMAFHVDPMIDDEYAEAWQYGPVFPSLYHEFKHRGRMPIVDFATEVDIDIEEAVPKIPVDDKQTRKFLNKIWSVYGGYSGIQLSEKCHAPGSPWEQTRKASGNRMNVNIDDGLIREYYRERLEKNRSRD